MKKIALYVSILTCACLLILNTHVNTHSAVSISLFDNQQIEWNIKSVFQKGSKTTSTKYKGKGIKVAVLDTGINTNHPDLKVVGGKSFVSYTDSYNDDNGHGTHIAGIIAAKDNTIGIRGIAPEVQLYALKVVDQDGRGSSKEIISAIEWSIENKIDIINMSLSLDKIDYQLHEAIKKAYNKGILFVASSGNKGEQINNEVSYPGKHEEVIAVGAFSQNKEHASFSSNGPEVEFSAGGVKILSTYLEDYYAYMDGTSMASAHVAGTLALLKEQYPNKTNEQLRKMLQSSVVDLGVPGKDHLFGFGEVRY